MDFVWPYFSGGAQGSELQLSIQSVLTNFQGNPKITIVGDRPSWYKHGQHIPIPRIRSQHLRSFRDTLNRLSYAANSRLIGNRFVWMMDDVYFMQPVSINDLSIGRHQGRWTRARADQWSPSNNWQTLKKQSIIRLLDDGLASVYDYATHLPHVVDKKRVKELFKRFQMPRAIYLWELLYGNLHYKNPHNTAGFFFRARRPQSVENLSQRHESIWNNTTSAWDKVYESFIRDTLSGNRTQHPQGWSLADQLDRQFPCDYRGPFVGTKKSSLCGMRGDTIPLFNCKDKNEVITIRPYRQGQPEPSCIKNCDRFWDNPTPTKAKSVIKLRFTHFHKELKQYWPRFVEAIEANGSRVEVDNETMKPDLVIGSLYYSRRQRPWKIDPHISEFRCRRVFWTEESARVCDQNCRVDYAQYDLCIGTQNDRPGFVCLPSWVIVCIDWKKPPMQFDGLLDTPELLCARDRFEIPKTKGGCFIASANWKYRTNLVANMMKKIPIDCPGKVHHNCDPGPLTKRQAVDRWTGKLEFLKPYRWTIAIENTLAPGYNTEKPMHALMTKTVPVYTERNGPFNIRKDCIAYYSPSIHHLLKSEEAMREMANEPVFDDPQAIRDSYGPKRLGEMLLG